MARGEFRVLDLDYAVYFVLAPMMFLMMWKHSVSACVPNTQGVTPEKYLAAQVENILHGLCVRPVPPASDAPAPCGPTSLEPVAPPKTPTPPLSSPPSTPRWP